MLAAANHDLRHVARQGERERSEGAGLQLGADDDKEVDILRCGGSQGSPGGDSVEEQRCFQLTAFSE